MFFGFLGARLFYVLYQEPSFYFTHPKEIFSVWNGGFVYYGGFLTASLFGYLFLIFKKQNVLNWLDAAAPVAALSYGLGRLACFFNGCCYGETTNFFLGVKFPGLEGLRHPTQLYAVVFELLIWMLLLTLESKLKYVKNNKGTLFFLWLSLHAIGRLVMEYFRADPRGPLVYGFTISTLISLYILAWSATWFFFFKLNSNFKR